MQPGHEIDLPSQPQPATVADELQLLCKKLADVDAIWRLSEAHQSYDEPQDWPAAA